MDSQGRVALAALVLSASGLVYIAQREGYSDRAYPDAVHGAKVPTNGFGSTAGVKMGDTTTPVRALVRLRADAGDVEVALKRCLPQDVPLFQREWDSFTGLGHNTGPISVCKNTQRTGPSTIVLRLQARDYAGACEAILLYKMAGGVDCSTPGNKVCGGLWKDRQRLRAMCLGEPMP